MFAFPLIPKKDKEEEIQVEESVVSSEAYVVLAEQLKKCMDEEKIYLNPKLTLQDVSTAIGTNRTYLSDYLNKILKTTVYEYVNSLRTSRACELIDLMTAENKRSIQEIAEVSGFNSISTFNRSFIKIMGMTPSQYLAKKQK
jgi:AraC-like DNA-binding protein